jgi:hypothetical protein
MLTVNSGRRLMNSFVPSRGVDENEAAALDVGNLPGRDSLLGDDRDARQSFGENGENHCLGTLVGFGHRRCVRFQRHMGARLVDLEDGPAGGQCCLFKRLDHAKSLPSSGVSAVLRSASPGTSGPCRLSAGRTDADGALDFAVHGFAVQVFRLGVAHSSIGVSMNIQVTAILLD